MSGLPSRVWPALNHHPTPPNNDNAAVRCMAVVGTTWTGPQYCGYRTTSCDRNGRPCCKRHLDQQLGIEWFGERRDYPHGIGGRWQWRHGEFRT